MDPLFTLSLLLLVVLCYAAVPDIRFPAFIFAVLWLLVTSAFYFAPIPVDRISITTQATIFTAIAAFAGAGLFLRLAESLAPPPRAVETGDDVPGRRARALLLLVSAVLLPLVIQKALGLAEASGFNNLYIGLRVELTKPNAEGYGVVGNAAIVSWFTTLIYAIDASRKERWLFASSFTISLIYAVLGTGRTPVFLLVVTVLAVALIRNRMTVPKFLGGLTVFALSFVLIAMVLGKSAGNADSDIDELGEGLVEHFYTYLLGSVGALNVVVGADAPLQLGRNTFSGVLNIVYRYTGEPEIPAIQDEVAVPFRTNVYTALHPLYVDFGILGVAVGFFVIGLLTNFLYFRALKQQRLYIFYYALAIYPLSYAVFSDQYFAPFTTWVKLIAAGYLYFTLVRARGDRSIPARTFPADLPQMTR
jgi:oligosaccharide repeat unit polymerase